MWYHLPKVIFFLVPPGCVIWSSCSPHSPHILSRGRFFPVLNLCSMEPLCLPTFILASFSVCMFFLFNSSSKKIKKCFSVVKANKSKLEQRYAGWFSEQSKNYNVFRKCSESKSSKPLLSVNNSKILCQWITRWWYVAHSGFPSPSNF